MAKAAYSYATGACILIAVVFQRGGDPFGRDFTQIVVPGLVLLVGLQWFLLPIHYLWKALGLCVDVTVFSLLFHYGSRSNGVDPLDFGTYLFLAMFAQAAILWFLAPDNSTRAIVVSTSLITSYVVFLGAYLGHRAIEYPLAASGRFLVLSPLIGMFLLVYGSTFKWRFATQVVLVCVVFQVGMGLFDVGQANGIRWMSVLCVLVWITGLGLIGLWAKDWNK
ncbi:MAG: hypothetical protein WB680_07360 [Candidatus Acidiferrales bacterium]